MKAFGKFWQWKIDCWIFALQLRILFHNSFWRKLNSFSMIVLLTGQFWGKGVSQHLCSFKINRNKKAADLVILSCTQLENWPKYRMEGNFGATKIWWKWQLTKNLPNCHHPNFCISMVKSLLNIKQIDWKIFPRHVLNNLQLGYHQSPSW